MSKHEREHKKVTLFLDADLYERFKAHVSPLAVSQAFNMMMDSAVSKVGLKMRRKIEASIEKHMKAYKEGFYQGKE